MQIRILGSAAGGGLPQWNCGCSNCVAVRNGSPHHQPRTQSSVAVSADSAAWFLLNASADVRQQIGSFRALGPPVDEMRGTSIAGCILTDAEIDHTSGLLQLREGNRFGVFSTAQVHGWLRRDFPIEPIVATFAERPWYEIEPDVSYDLPLPSGAPSNLRVRPFETGRDVPRYVTSASPDEAAGAVVGLRIEDRNTGGVLVYAPGVQALSERLIEAAGDARCMLIDGTFWSDDEPARSGFSTSTARQMGHLPVSGEGGTLGWLSRLPISHRVYVHINNTNPMLDESGLEWKQVSEAGVRVGADGDTLEI